MILNAVIGKTLQTLKYWYVSYVRKSCDENKEVRCVVLENFHPFEAVKQWNKDDEHYSFVILYFQEISKEEYDMLVEEVG